MTKARLIYVAVVLLLVLVQALTFASIVPFGYFDGDG
jgi:hypothetical protein